MVRPDETDDHSQHFIALAALFFALVASSTDGRALPAFCAVVEPITGPFGYGTRSSGKWCEGLYTPSVSGPIVELLNATRKNASLKAAALPSSITIGYSGVKASDAAIHVTALSYLPDSFYRLDTVLTSTNRAIEISTATVIGPAGLDLSQIGFVGQRGTEIVPLIVASPFVEPSTNEVDITLRASGLVTEVKWRWDPSCTSSLALRGWSTVAGAIFPSNSPIQINDIPQPATPCDLEVILKSNGQWSAPTRWRFGT
jgi:hypothetical protein